MDKTQILNQRLSDFAYWVISHPDFFGFTKEQMTEIADEYLAEYVSATFEIFDANLSEETVQKLLEHPDNLVSDVQQEILSKDFDSPDANIACAYISYKFVEVLLDHIKPEYAQKALDKLAQSNITPEVIDMVDQEFNQRFSVKK